MLCAPGLRSHNGYWAGTVAPNTINWTTSDVPADQAGPGNFQSNRVWIETLQSPLKENRNE